MRRLTRKRKILLGLGLIALAVTALWSTFGYVSICTTCGRMEHTAKWQLPFTPVTYWTSRSETDSPISAVVAKHGLVDVHRHTWLFAAGGGNGIMCAIGEGRYLQVSRPQVAAALDGIATYQGKPAAQQWLKRLLDPKQSVFIAGQLGDAPAEGFVDKSNLRNGGGRSKNF